MRVIGHRGTPTCPLHPENTVAAVRAALEAGADGVEVDVQATADGVLVLSHDRDLGRVLGTGAGTGPVVARTPSVTLGALDLPNGTAVPTLTEVLDLAAASGAHVLTEVKPEAGGRDARRTAGLLAALLAGRRRRRPGADRVTTTSFDLVTAASLAGYGTVSGALIVPAHQDPERSALRARARGLTDVHLSPVHVRRDPGVVPRIRALGLLVGVGVLDDPAEAAGLADRDVHLVCTDDPAGMVRALAPAPVG
ncbi:glycerophosphodiester phosphodiesterase [Geodermatophilus sabuli]|uniref:Glycerophosphodiester phosphodiesterase n=1 Tax=Geodermatophilus sabuli TaxID=1564158 RepID=A0A7K3VUE3_9ACTN|nr:glycerophosphodiester phosphodiesterase [Geodermatophilus sabuli]NEK56271.1 glycerophosphodiester phosphodiesterase [Geodermatophilus sabuli]